MQSFENRKLVIMALPNMTHKEEVIGSNDMVNLKFCRIDHHHHKPHVPTKLGRLNESFLSIAGSIKHSLRYIVCILSQTNCL